ncbi:S8 family serine peptidase (plasmid) [Priestia megaterium]|uniref:Leader peptide-processing serine protease n=1 Tax=Priestia megaterium (strain ATCC 14581 / DSM 32 / CCUG 1817 / JCM 2506 / NBRC 15308 / NCIMB 9376 / NCTC 10342 / NRRL B-14308 / VKM B-512 / Ford 19) TaxID=1348623 RepID=A0A0B6AYN9_PRIM2|nr:S8 family serine peptidase [Priestia megaterium]AJI25823.1 subtilase family protein [Priestia megaterium NBRC 15308 = ATCC 14581]KFN07517.1 subtilase family protein [Priestia megaterium]KGJ82767.1 peptidase S8 [Priestia megaterium NBRC 15308 = ATCC 14581]MDR4229740.1 S8 family serine peptidase [Priestia megaterium]MED4399184.1 S8 family serine peptidase [Priestia megaterium]
MRTLRILLLNAICFTLILCFSFSNAVAAEESSYSILMKDSADFNLALNQLEKEKQEVIYSIPEIKLIQVQGVKNKILSTLHSGNIDEINKSNGEFKTYTPNINKQSISDNQAIWNQQWDMKRITHNGESYKMFTPTGAVSVGVVDSGLPEDHSDFKNISIANSKNLVPKNGYQGKEPWETGNVDQLTDLTGHGTGVISQINADGLMKGVAPNIPVTMYRAFGKSSAEAIWVIKGIIEAAKDGNDVINISAGSYLLKNGKYSDGSNDKTEIKAYEKAIQYANKRGSIVVSALGNDSVDVNKKNNLLNILNNQLEEESKSAKGIVQDIPAQLPNVISVASTGPNQEISSFSNYGKNQIDFTAPGGDIQLLNKYGSDTWLEDELFKKELILVAHPQGGYYFNYGNSLATPKVSGALALVIDKYGYKNKPHKAVNKLKKSSTGQNEIDLYNALKN